jgi:hypothetical protein
MEVVIIIVYFGLLNPEMPNFFDYCCAKHAMRQISEEDDDDSGST